jgi:hypothetical protein
MNESSCHYCVHSASHITCCQLSCVLISLHNVLQAWAEVYDSPQARHALHLCKCVCHRVNFLVPQPVQTLQQYPQAITFQKLQQPFPGKQSIKGKGNSLHNLLPWCDAIRSLHTFFTSALHDEQRSALCGTHLPPSLPSSGQTVHILISSRVIMSFRNQRAATNQNTTNWPGDTLPHSMAPNPVNPQHNLKNTHITTSQKTLCISNTNTTESIAVRRDPC